MSCHNFGILPQMRTLACRNIGTIKVYYYSMVNSCILTLKCKLKNFRIFLLLARKSFAFSEKSLNLPEKLCNLPERLLTCQKDFLTCQKDFQLDWKTILWQFKSLFSFSKMMFNFVIIMKAFLNFIKFVGPTVMFSLVKGLNK